MSKEIKFIINKFPILFNFMEVLKLIKLPWLDGLSLYDLIKLYGLGMTQSAFSNRASSIAFSFFMSLFPFALFILNLIPFIPIDGFESDFLAFVEDGVPPNTFHAIENIINDILTNSHTGLVSTGFLLSIFLMSNGVNAILGGFDKSTHVVAKRSFLNQYLVALGLSLFLSFLLILNVAIIVVLEVLIQITVIQDVLSDKIPLLILGRYAFLILMMIIATSVLFKYGSKDNYKEALITKASIFSTVLTIVVSYFFGIWVINFSKYNELYGSIGTLLIVMFYIWINCMILLLGFELNAIIKKHRERVNKLA